MMPMEMRQPPLEDACRQVPETEATAADHLHPSMSGDIAEVPEDTMTEMPVPPQGRNEGQVHPDIEEDHLLEVRDIMEIAMEEEGTDITIGDTVEMGLEIDIPVGVREVTERIDTGMTEIANLVYEMVPKHQHLEIHRGI